MAHEDTLRASADNSRPSTSPSLESIRIELSNHRDLLIDVRGLVNAIECALEGDQPRLQAKSLNTEERAAPAGMVGQMAQQLTDNINESHSIRATLENITKLVGQG